MSHAHLDRSWCGTPWLPGNQHVAVCVPHRRNEEPTNLITYTQHWKGQVSCIPWILNSNGQFSIDEVRGNATSETVTGIVQFPFLWPGFNSWTMYTFYPVFLLLLLVVVVHLCMWLSFLFSVQRAVQIRVLSKCFWRVHNPSSNTFILGLKSLQVWIDYTCWADTGVWKTKLLKYQLSCLCIVVSSYVCLLWYSLVVGV